MLEALDAPEVVVALGATPVEVGAMLYFNSQVCFTHENYAQIRVSAEVLV